MRHLITSIVVIILFLGFTQDCLRAAVLSNSPDPVNAITIPGKKNQQNYKLFISLPDNYNPKKENGYPVLYVLDANGLFTLMTQVYDLLRLSNEVPEMIIVGIGYDVERFSDSFALRVSDLTPSRDIDEDRMLGSMYNSEVQSGGASYFLSAISESIIPHIDTHYNTNGTRALAGFSLGGLFTTYALLNDNRIFTHYLIGSPSYWWDDGLIFRKEREFARKNNELPANVFISVGSLEEELMIRPVKVMSQSLYNRKYKGLNLHTHIFENERHFSVIPATLSRGIRVLFSQ